MLQLPVTGAIFYEDRAEVERRGRVTLLGGRQRFRLEGLSAAIVDDSVRIESGTAVALSQSVQREFLPLQGDQVQLESEVVRVGLELLRKMQAEQALEARERQIQAMLGHWLLNRTRLGPQDLDSWQKNFQTIFHSCLEGKVALQKARMQRQAAELEIARAEKAVEAHAAQALRPQSALEFELDGESGDLEICVRYWTACALWRPEYRADLRGERLHLEMLAVLWQNTGEDWSQVACRVATGRPSAYDKAPIPIGSRVGLKAKDPNERLPVPVHDRAEPGAASPRLKVLDLLPEDGVALTMAAADLVDLPSRSTPTRARLATTELECEARAWAFPEISSGVHLRVEAEHDGFGRGWPLLAGPVRYQGGGLTRMLSCCVGERFHLSLGLREGLSVRRQQKLQNDVVPLTGTQRATARNQVSVHNLTPDRQLVRLRERIPVSQLAEIKVSLRAPDGHRFDERTGFLDFDLELEPYQTLRLDFSYRVYATPQVQFISA